MLTLAGRLPPGVEGDALGDRVQPGCQRCLARYGGSSPNEHKEGSLKGVFGVMAVAEHSAADPKHHGPMAVDKDGKGSLVPLAAEALHQLGITQVASGLSSADFAQVY